MADTKSKDLPNIKALISFRLKGKAVEVGDVVAKSEFANRGDWQNLVHMNPPRAEETDAAVGKAKKAEKAKPATVPGA